MWLTKEEEALLRDELKKFLDDADEEPKTEQKDHICEEGMTIIDEWTICKYCGDNMRKIK